jgi:hypothetical protein
VNILFDVYGNLNVVLASCSKPSLKCSSENNTMDLADFNAESPEDWACRFYWEAYFEKSTHSSH